MDDLIEAHHSTLELYIYVTELPEEYNGREETVCGAYKQVTSVGDVSPNERDDGHLEDDNRLHGLVEDVPVAVSDHAGDDAQVADQVDDHCLRVELLNKLLVHLDVAQQNIRVHDMTLVDSPLETVNIRLP